jgi:hypothetical protein
MEKFYPKDNCFLDPIYSYLSSFWDSVEFQVNTKTNGFNDFLNLFKTIINHGTKEDSKK